jgi:hypothetical protein
MKKYFVLALVLMAFAIAPVMADVALSGEYTLSGAYDLDAKDYADKTDKMELDFKATLDDYNTLKFELEDDGKENGVTTTSITDEDLTINYINVITDWGKYFGFAESGFGLVSTVGLDGFGYKETVDFTGYELEYNNNVWLDKNNAMMLDFDIAGVVAPYFAMNFDTMGGNGAQYLLGATIDVAPVAAEVYYMSNGKVGAETAALVGGEAVFSSEVSDGVVATVGGFFQMEKDAADEFNNAYGFGAGAEAYGATVNLSANGMTDYAIAQLGVDADYSILEWLSVNGGMLFNMGDWATDNAGDEAFAGAEFGVAVAPGAVTYKLGYMMANEDANLSYIMLQSKANAGPKGGLYFVADLNY